MRRGVPVRRVGEHLVTTVYDLCSPSTAWQREGLPGDWPTGYDDAQRPDTPAWQAQITSVPARLHPDRPRVRPQRRGIRRPVHDPHGCRHLPLVPLRTIYRSFLALLTLTGCQGRNGGGWAHYVGQEKCRPTPAGSRWPRANDWSRPPRTIGTSFLYLNTDQWRYDRFRTEVLASPLASGALNGMAGADCLARPHGWAGCRPTRRSTGTRWTSPTRRGPRARRPRRPRRGGAEGRDGSARLRGPRRPAELAANPDAVAGQPAGLLGQGRGVLPQAPAGNPLLAQRRGSPEDVRPRDVKWPAEAPEGKLDLLLSLDFRMTSSALLSDVVLPAATWYEKHDLSSTDMHPYIHSFSPAVDPPWQARTDFDAFHAIARNFSELADPPGHPPRHRRRAAAARHPRGDRAARGRGPGLAARRDAGVPGKTMPALAVVERDYTAIAAKMAVARPAGGELGLPVKGVTFVPDEEVAALAAQRGTRGGAADGRPLIDTGIKGRRDPDAVRHQQRTPCRPGLPHLEKRVGKTFAHLAESTRASGSPTPTPRPRRYRSSPHPSGPAANPADAATRRSP